MILKNNSHDSSVDSVADKGSAVSDVTTSGKALSVIADEVAYAGTVKGLFARPEAPGVYPGVVMIHEWWGLNENIKTMARTLASEGYEVLAVDLYDGKVATTAEEARALVGAVEKEKAVKNLKSAVEYLRKNGAPKIASLGWCFGGGQSLQLALSGEKLDATVIYYGTLVTDKSQLSKISFPVLGIFGGKDTSIPTSTVNTFRDTLTSLGVKNSVTIYPDVGHAFANPSGANYAPDETRDAWNKTLTFLSENLK